MAKPLVKPKTSSPRKLAKSATGIKGFDQITDGGLPKNNITLISGGAGSGKTLFGLDFVISGALEFGEPGVFVSFEESNEDLIRDVASLNWDLKGLVAKRQLVLEFVTLERRDILEAEFNLEGLIVRLENAIDSVGAKRVVLDSIESLFAGITDQGILRLEIKRLFRWLKNKGVTALVSVEPGPNGAYSRHGVEEYISDCIVFLDNRVNEQHSIRRIRIIKYRGSSHGTNEYPFIIDHDGLSVIPITSATLNQRRQTKRISTGIPSLNKLFQGGGYITGSSVLLSGTAGTGKTSLAAAFIVEQCRRGERCIFLSYEESPEQLMENMNSIGLDMAPFVKSGLLRIEASRPSSAGLEKHLLDLYKTIAEFKPKGVVIDPLTSLIGEGSEREVKSMVTRMLDHLKSEGITAVCTSLVSSTAPNHSGGEIGVSSLIDTWIVVRELEEDDGMKRIRGLYIVKSRGMGHSSDVHKLVLNDDGISLVPVDPSETLMTAGRNASETKKMLGS